MSDAASESPSSVSAVRPRVVKAPRLDAVAAMEARVAAAKAEADKILADAKAEAQRIHSQAEQDGRRAAAEIAMRCAAAARTDAQRMRSKLPDLVMAAVRRVLSGYHAADVIARAADQAAKEFPSAPTLILRVAPDLVDKVEREIASLSSAPIKTVADPNRPGESSLLETPYGDVELGIDAQLEALKIALERAL